MRRTNTNTNTNSVSSKIKSRPKNRQPFRNPSKRRDPLENAFDHALESFHRNHIRQSPNPLPNEKYKIPLSHVYARIAHHVSHSYFFQLQSWIYARVPPNGINFLINPDRCLSLFHSTRIQPSRRTKSQQRVAGRVDH